MAAIHKIGGFQVSDQVLGAVREASRKTGVDFAYMMSKAARESGFDAEAEAATSSATGLYQFIDQTWLGMVKTHGEAHGLGRLARQIDAKSDGSFAVGDSAARRRILDLRTDPEINALMAAEYANDNKRHLEGTVGGEIGPTELYFAHFLGAGGAETFLTSLRRNPHQPADQLLPGAAAANRAVFYDPETGRARSLAEIYDSVAGTIGRDMAMAGGLPDGDATASTLARTPASRVAAYQLPNNAGGIGTGGAAGTETGHDAGTEAAMAMLGGRRLSLWTVLTLSAVPLPGQEGQDGVTDARRTELPGALFG